MINATLASTALAISLVLLGSPASAQYIVPGSQAYPGQPVYGQPVYGQPVYGQPVYGQPVYGQPVYGQPAYGQPVAVAQPPAPSRARFSVGRYFLESLVGGALGAAAGYGVLRLACGNDVCLGGALGALGANIALTPLAVWGLGRLTGGEGTLGSAYLGGSFGLGLGGGTAAINPSVSLAIGMTFMPFISALFFEFSSAQTVTQQAPQGVQVQSLNLRPLASPSASLAGLSLEVGGRF